MITPRRLIAHRNARTRRSAGRGADRGADRAGAARTGSADLGVTAGRRVAPGSAERATAGRCAASTGSAERAAAGRGEPAFAVHDLTVAYDSTPALWDIDLEVPRGVLMAIVGPNGAGKSTLIKAALGLVPRTAGTVRFYGKPYGRMRRLVGYVPQRGSVDWDFPTTVLDVVTMGRYGSLGWVRRPGRHERDLAMEALEKVAMVDYADRQISRLSGGQQQRTFLARALVQDADIYFMDEPFAAVDAVTERAIVKVLQDLRESGKTVIVVHHDLSTVMSYFDWVTLLNVEVQATGPKDQIFTRRNLEQTYGGRLDTLPVAGVDPAVDSAQRGAV